jgi:hypothetical protein
LDNNKNKISEMIENLKRKIRPSASWRRRKKAGKQFKPKGKKN